MCMGFACKGQVTKVVMHEKRVEMVTKFVDHSMCELKKRNLLPTLFDFFATLVQLFNLLDYNSSNSVPMAAFLLQFFRLPELVDFLLPSSHHFPVVAFAAMVTMYVKYRKKVSIYLVDFTCYDPPKSFRLPTSMFVEHIFLENMDPNSIALQVKILEKSGFSEETSIPPFLAVLPPKKTLSSAVEEAMSVMFTTVDDLLNRNNINPKAIDILICNSSMFCPVPSLSAMLVNRFKMRSNIKSFHLSGMGCSAGIISVSLAKDLLRVDRNSLALIVSSEALLLNWYTGKNPSMLITNCLFRMGGAALLLSSRTHDKSRAKYELQHVVRTNKAQDDQSHSCVYQDADEEKIVGVSISKSILTVAGFALNTNIAALGPLVLPFSEQLRYVSSVIRRRILSRSISIYTPVFSKAFEHFCIHAGGRAVIKAIEKNLKLTKENVEPSNMTLYKFGNTSSSSIWYELCYIEAKGRMRKGDRVWQLAFGSGFKCNSAAWKCVNDVVISDASSPWRDVIHLLPVEVPQTRSLLNDNLHSLST